MIAFNVNDKVLVKLNGRGLRILREQHYELMRNIPEAARWKYNPPKEDENGWSEWQLWELMQRFGPHIALGSMPPFDTEIKIPTEADGR